MHDDDINNESENLGDILRAALYSREEDIEKKSGSFMEFVMKNFKLPAASESVQLRYTGQYKIAAIKSIRAVLSIDLKTAKDAIESKSGFIITGVVARSILWEYMHECAVMNREPLPSHFEVMNSNPIDLR